MNRITLTLIATVLLADAATAETFTITGQNGATYAGTRICDRSPGQISCNQSGILTLPGGATSSRTRQSTLTQGTLTTTVSGTRAFGHGFGRNVTVRR